MRISTLATLIYPKIRFKSRRGSGLIRDSTSTKPPPRAQDYLDNAEPEAYSSVRLDGSTSQVDRDRSIAARSALPPPAQPSASLSPLSLPLSPPPPAQPSPAQPPSPRSALLPSAQPFSSTPTPRETTAAQQSKITNKSFIWSHTMPQKVLVVRGVGLLSPYLVRYNKAWLIIRAIINTSKSLNMAGA